MTSAATAPTRDKAPPNPWIRETIDSFAVALILAFLFRAFVAEAFVIPTGSMAPTLMGAHKDLICPQCGCSYQAGVSEEFRDGTSALTDKRIIGTTCPLCRFEQPIDLTQRPNDASFPGDRILVSKLSYVQGDPQRWEVIVFKYPSNSRQNFIKRLIGLPNETVHIEHGDIYIKHADDQAFEIARKPPDIAETLLQEVSDTDLRPALAVEAGLPSPWQPAGPLAEQSDVEVDAALAAGWTVKNDPQQWSAQFGADANAAKSDLQWLRYYHYVLNPRQWSYLLSQNKLPAPVPPRSSRLISDFAHYNGVTRVDGVGSDVSAQELIPVRREYGLDLKGNRNVSRDPASTDGYNWVGDLAAEFDVEIEKADGKLAVDLVEAGVHYQATFDLGTGGVQIDALEDGQPLAIFGSSTEKSTSITGQAGINGTGAYKIKFANVDDSLYLWVNGDLVDFQGLNLIATTHPLNLSGHRPKYSATDAGDAAPIGLGATAGMNVRVTAARVWRDVYYTSGIRTSLAADYERFGDLLKASITEEATQDYLATHVGELKNNDWMFGYGADAVMRDVLFSKPALWGDAILFERRVSSNFVLGEGQYFPMGDNSNHSSDARLWIPEHFVHRDLMIGRAALVFWPHTWNAPVKMLPNFKRMGIIR